MEHGKNVATTVTTVVTAINVASGKCLDVEILSNYCKGCERWTNEDRSKTEYREWLTTHICQANHQGSSGSMEPEGAIRMFQRSEKLRDLRYVEYLGDGDTASFRKVKTSKPYGDDEIVKLECIGHLQKRVGSRMRKLKVEYKGKKLGDGKRLTGAGRLTDRLIDTLQNYYGMAIRRNCTSVNEMQRAIMASFYHLASTDDNPNHSFCPVGPDSWCQYYADGVDYKHKHGLPEVIIELLEPIYDDLSDPELLGRCLHGKTQNPNESINKTIWDKCPKTVWMSRKVVSEATYSAVVLFNDGNSSRSKIHTKLGLSGCFTNQACRDRDLARLQFAGIKASVEGKARRKQLRAIKKGFGDKCESSEGILYEKGAF